jgi:hypothetical protein
MSISTQIFSESLDQFHRHAQFHYGPRTFEELHRSLPKDTGVAGHFSISKAKSLNLTGPTTQTFLQLLARRDDYSQYVIRFNPYYPQITPEIVSRLASHPSVLQEFTMSFSDGGLHVGYIEAGICGIRTEIGFLDQLPKGLRKVTFFAPTYDAQRGSCGRVFSILHTELGRIARAIVSGPDQQTEEHDVCRTHMKVDCCKRLWEWRWIQVTSADFRRAAKRKLVG